MFLKYLKFHMFLKFPGARIPSNVFPQHNPSKRHSECLSQPLFASHVAHMWPVPTADNFFRNIKDLIISWYDCRKTYDCSGQHCGRSVHLIAYLSIWQHILRKNLVSGNPQDRPNICRVGKKKGGHSTTPLRLSGKHTLTHSSMLFNKVLFIIPFGFPLIQVSTDSDSYCTSAYPRDCDYGYDCCCHSFMIL